MRFRHVILDRDGVLNREPAEGFVVDRAAWQWEVGALEALQLLARNGIRATVATNQSCIGRGIATAAQVHALHAWMREEARRCGASIAHVYVCPHVDSDTCACRKPLPGLVRRAVDISGIAARETLLIGDSRRDLEAARAAGVTAALVRTGKGAREERACGDLAAWTFDDLLAAAKHVAGLRAFPPRDEADD